MKKVTILLLAVITIMACKKEMVQEANVQPQPLLSEGNLMDYEEYEPNGDLETEIRNALLALEDDDNLGYTSINRGIWILETGLNYLLPDNLYDYDSIYSESSSYIIALNDNGEMVESNIKSSFAEAYSFVNTHINSSTKHVGTDFYVSAINGNNIQLEAKHLFLKGSSGTLTQTGKPVGTTNQDRVAGYPYKCPYVAGNGAKSAWQEAKENAEDALRSYWGNNSNINPKYYTNIIRYSSTSRNYPTVYFSPEHLLGNSASYVQAHQNPVNAELCITAAEQNLYAQAVYDDVSLKTAKTRGVLYLVVANNNNLVLGPPSYYETTWYYRDLTIGTNGWFSPSLPVLTLTYL